MSKTSAALPFAALACALAVIGQAGHAVQVHDRPVDLLAGILPMLGAALLLCGTFAMLEGWRRPWPRRALRALLTGAALATALASAVAAIGLWQTGAVPRAQQLSGLTWDMVAPSVATLARRHATAIVVALALLLCTLALLSIGVRHARRSSLHAAHLALIGILGLAIGLYAHQQGSRKVDPFVAIELFKSDLDVKQALSEKALQEESRFFKTYYRDLAETEGTLRYPQIHARLRGSNIIWVVLESVRAKDVPLYGGAADMPHLMKARQHMVLFDHLYAQDPRSTKAFTQMDLGRFSLLSWDTYSNNIPWMFPEDGMASHLRQLNYSTTALVNSDANYDNNQLFQERHGYDQVMYRQALNPDSANSDDLKLLERVESVIASTRKPFYMMVWPIQTHHPYGREHWTQAQENHNAQDAHQPPGAADFPRYLRALNQADDWFGRLIELLKTQGVDHNTMIIVTGDHGQAFAEHEPGNVFHGNGVYEDSVHILGFIYHPGIDGLQRDKRHHRLLDVPASLLDLASGQYPVFNDGRSIFRNFTHAMPIYLFNSWAGAIGVIHDGHKLWRRVKWPEEAFFASIQDIRKNPGKERQRLTPGRGEAQLRLLNEWESAMLTRSARLLAPTTALQPPLNDIIRVYCDDGTGFHEDRKGMAAFVGLSGKVTLTLDSDCRALRIAPIHRTTLPEGTYIDLNITDLRALGSDTSWTPGDLQPIAFKHIETISDTEFRITGNSSFLDYRLDSRNHRIGQVTMDVTYAWGRRWAGPPAAATPTAKAAP